MELKSLFVVLGLVASASLFAGEEPEEKKDAPATEEVASEATAQPAEEVAQPAVEESCCSCGH